MGGTSSLGSLRWQPYPRYHSTHLTWTMHCSWISFSWALVVGGLRSILPSPQDRVLILRRHATAQMEMPGILLSRHQ
jgi:hypothetical protein